MNMNGYTLTSLGQQLQAVNIPALRITSCCFGGKNVDEFYVTCSAHEVSEEEFQKYPLTGSVFRVKGLGVKGFKAKYMKEKSKRIKKSKRYTFCINLIKEYSCLHSLNIY